jgi:hypothetical protein
LIFGFGAGRVVESSKRRDYRKYDSLRQGHHPLSSTPKSDRPAALSMADDKRGIEAARASTPDEKLRALRQYRRAKGLCDMCAKKWSYGHKCSTTVQLHAMQELWELFPEEECSLESQGGSVSGDESAQLYLFLSKAAAGGTESTMSMRLM